jgi:hypothetical protein
MILLRWSKAVMLVSVTAAKALDKQIEHYRQMTGEQRLKIALELHELSCNITREGIRHQNSAADEAEVERLLHQRIQLANSKKQKVEIAVAMKLG